MKASPGISPLSRVAVALLAGLTVFSFLFQWGGGNSADPPTCFGMFGWYAVACGGWSAVAIGALTAGIGWLALWWADRSKPPTTMRLGSTVLIALGVFVVVVPTSGAGIRCFSLVALGVPCDGTVAAAAAAISAVIVGPALWLRGRQRVT